MEQVLDVSTINFLANALLAIITLFFMVGSVLNVLLFYRMNEPIKDIPFWKAVVMIVVGIVLTPIMVPYTIIVILTQIYRKLLREQEEKYWNEHKPYE